MENLINFILHINEHLVNIVNLFGNWTYLIILLITFIETGAVIFPFLPGDSLIFAAAALTADSRYHLSIIVLLLITLFGSLLGDSCNFEIGKKVGIKLLNHKLVKKLIGPSSLQRVKDFIKQNGTESLFLARFIPLIRTLAPFIAASSEIKYKGFIKYNWPACITWTLLFCLSGYFFGNIPFIQSHFSLIIIGIIVVSLLPSIIGLLKACTKK
ncbi:membrane protein [Philodulcilactobacillus myokoensis]|uniref:Membrane protein n=1 Tax=Philodulcilactobacillus myokoensis TaxID=2929573 RepID=A0A9W6B0F4_9LACO|nr:VTT domain-containing protein [Philodulcilactobacillus myokoensis]GLB46714.1 membrane protein [Philodulcilactobacillus myokoensis]